MTDYPKAPGGVQDDGRVIEPDLDSPEEDEDSEVSDDGGADG